MAKKRSKQNKPAPNFSASPFKSLKGFAVSEEESRLVTEEPEEKQPEGSSLGAGDDDLFAREMERLGLDHKPSSPSETQTETTENKLSHSENEDADFLAAMHDLRVDFQDELPEEPQVPKPSARRERQLRRGQLEPEEELDLHGLTRDQAREKVGFFLDNACFQGVRTVLLITGRGYGSSGEPVLRSEVERLLRLEEGKTVLEWMVAPRRYGGAGALVVFLKKRS